VAPFLLVELWVRPQDANARFVNGEDASKERVEVREEAPRGGFGRHLIDTREEDISGVRQKVVPDPVEVNAQGAAVVHRRLNVARAGRHTHATPAVSRWWAAG